MTSMASPEPGQVSPGRDSPYRWPDLRSARRHRPARARRRTRVTW